MPSPNTKKLTPKQNIIAFGLIFAILATLLLRLYASDKELSVTGPHFIVSTNATVLLIYNTDLLHLDNQGSSIRTIPLSHLGIETKVADIQILDDTRFVIGDWDNMRILLCSLKELDCHSLSKNLATQIRNFYKFHYRENHNDIFITDTDRHRIMHYDIARDVYKEISVPKQLIYPNHIRIERDGFVYVTNTNRHRISYYRYNGEQLESAGKPYRSNKSLSSKTWPVFHYLHDNGMYTLQGNNFLKFSDLLFFPVTANAQKLALPPNSDVTAIANIDNKLLMSDRNLFTIHALDPITQELSVFGKGELLELFKRDRDTVKFWGALSLTMLVLLIMTVIGVVVFVIYVKQTARQETEEVETNIASSQSGVTTQHVSSLPPIVPGVVTWLDPNPLMRRLLFVLGILIIAIIMLGYFTLSLLHVDFSAVFTESPDFRFIYLISLMVITFIVVYINAYNNISSRIGTDGIHIYSRTLLGKKRFPPQEVIYSKHYLAWRSVTIAYRNNLQQYFLQKSQFEAYITPLLETHATKVGNFSILVHMLKNPNLLGIFNTLAFTAIFSIIFYLMYNNYLIF